MPAPEFVYLDLGNVLCTFDNGRSAAQMSELSGLPAGQLRDFFGIHDFQNKLERGEIAFADVSAALSAEAGTKMDPTALEKGYSDIFGLVPGIVALVARLAEARIPLGILSNTSAPHWRLVTDGRFAILPRYFNHFALSFEIGAMKPDPEIFSAAEKIAGVQAAQIFFTDDLEENVEAAREAGWDAVQFESPGQLAAELHARGLRFNY